MSQSLDPGEDRIAWLESACAECYASLPKPFREWLDTSVRPEFSHVASRVAIVASCLNRVLFESPLSKILPVIRERFFLPETSVAEMEEWLGGSASDWYLRNSLRPWPHWALLHVDLDATIYHIFLRLRGGMGDGDIRSELEQRWGCSGHDHQDAVLSRAYKLSASFPPGFKLKSLRDKVWADVCSSGSGGGESSELETERAFEFPVYLRWCAKLLDAVESGRFPTKSQQILEPLANEVAEWIREGTFLEQDGLRRLRAIKALTAEHICDAWRIVVVDVDGQRRPAMQTSTGDRIPSWLLDSVVGGGRGAHGVVGPLPYWYIALDRQLSRPPAVIGASDPKCGDDWVRIQIAIPDNPDDPVMFDFDFKLQYTSHLVALAFVVATGLVRFDILSIEPSLRILRSLHWSLPDSVVQKLRRALEGYLSRNFGSSVGDVFQSAFSDEKTHAKVGFLMAEWSKVEDLIEDVALASHFTEGKELKEWADYSAKRERWLQVEAAHARELNAAVLTGRHLSHEARATALHDYRIARDRLRGASTEAFGGLLSERRVERLAQCLGGDEAFIHLMLRDGVLQVLVLRHGGDGLTIECYPLVDVNVEVLRRIASLLAGRPTEEQAGIALGEFIDILHEPFVNVFGALLADGIKSVVISPPSELDALPFHILPSVHGRHPAFLAFEAFSYCASAFLFAECARAQRPTSGEGVSVLGFGGLSGLKYLNDELASIERAWPEAQVWAGPAATPRRAIAELGRARVLHFACHGHWFPDNPLASVLELYDPVRSRGVLSAAELLSLAKGSVATDLVVLSSCYGGLHQISQRSVHRFSAMDTIFLRAGVRAVVSALWSVRDQDAYRFGEILHAALSRGCTLAAAYRLAIAAAIDDAVPKDRAEFLRGAVRWGAFRVVGDARIRLSLDEQVVCDPTVQN